MRHCLLAAALLCAPAFADSEARIGADWVRISATPCKNEEVLKHLKDDGENSLDYRAATASWQGLVPFRDLKPVKDI